MPISTEIQNKVLKIAASKSVNEQTKLAVRKQFYVLKQEEVDFDIKVAEFSSILDNVLTAIMEAEIPVAPSPKPVKPKASFEDIQTEPEEIIIPQATQKTPGVKVRMQETIDAVEESTDFEVPFEADEK